MKKLSNSLYAVMLISVVYLFCSCVHPQTQDEWLDENAKLLQKVELYEQYYEAAENFRHMVEKQEWYFHKHDWNDTYYESEEAQDLFAAKADIEDMLNNVPEDSTCVYMPSYNDLLKERNMLWNLLQITAAQDTTK